MSHADTFQEDPFSDARWAVRTTRSGATVRLRLERAEAGTVRILRYERRGRNDRAFQRRPAEEGRLVPLSSLLPDVSEEDLFGA